MKKFFLVAVATGLLAVTAAAQSSQVTGYSALIAIGNARGVQPPLTVARLQGLKAGTSTYRQIMEKLRVSPSVFAGLLKYGNTLAPSSLITRAALESATGKTLLEGSVAGLIKQNPKLAVNDQQSLNTLLSDPTTLALANEAANNAGAPITPRGGGN